MVQTLEQLADPTPQRETLAHLRHGLRGREVNTAYVLARVGWLFCRVPPDDEADAILTASLFALTKGASPSREGWSVGRAFGSLPGKRDNISIERRFIDLLDTDA